MHPKPSTQILFWESTIPTYGLSKILQVSCHRCNKVIKIASKSVRSFSVREIERCTNLWWQNNKSDRIHNKGSYHKAQYKLMFFCTKRLSIQPKSAWQPLLPSAKGISFTFMYLLSCKSQSFSLMPFYFLFWQASCGEERSRHIHPVGYGWHELLLLTSPLRWIRWEAKL